MRISDWVRRVLFRSGLWIAAGGVPPWWTLVVFSLGVWLTRSAGCVINDYADRWLDPQVERTKDRPLATGAVRGREALALFAVLMLAAFTLVLTMNRLTILMSVVGVGRAADREGVVWGKGGSRGGGIGGGR